MSEAPRLEIKSQKESGLVCLQLSGIIDERFNAAQILSEVAPVTILELSGIRRITSFGVRQWTEVMKTLPSSVKHLYLLRCPPVFIDQLSMVLNFGGRSQVISAYASYACDKCGEESLSLLDFLADHNQIASGQLPEVSCPKCKVPMQLVDDPQTYGRLVNEFGAKTLDAGAASLLERSGLHAVRRVGRPPEATKLVHEQITLFRLSGTLDGRFRQRRLASGVEGDVVFDLGEIEGLDATGAERWRELLAELSGATSITLIDVPDVLLPAIADGRFAVNGAGLYSYQVLFLCADCGGLETRPLRAGEPLAAVTRPCQRCGRTAEPATDANLIEQVFTRARPAVIAPAIEEVIRNRNEILQRARAESGTLSQQASGGDSLARYRVIKPLTEGGMAEIFLAVHQGIAGFEKLVVLKKILRKMLERRQVAVTLFLNEAKIAANLNHANIVQTFEVGEHGGDLFIAMEYIHGVDVRRLLRESVLKGSSLPIELVLYIGERVAAALHHAHTAKDLSGRNLNIVHRDVSPSNIIVGFDGQIKLLDFGVASAAVGESFDGLIGKFSYMSPEQIQRAALDGRSDVFALGVVLHEMLSRKPLFRREKDAETVRAVLEAPIPRLPAAVPDDVNAVITRALARNRDERYPDARALQVALEECIRKIGSMPTTEQVARTIEKLFPDQSAAPAIDPSLYRSTSSEMASASPASMRSASGSEREEVTATSPKEGDATVVTNRSAIPEAEPAPAEPKKRWGTFPNASVADTPSPGPAKSLAMWSDDRTQNGKRPVTPPPGSSTLPTPPPGTGQASQPAPATPPVATLSPLPGLNVLPPMTPPPPTPAPRPLPAPLQVSTPLDEEMALATPQGKGRSLGDYWLIAAAVAAFIVGLLLVVL